ncbi:uncharacterized protein family [Actinidia rufa]|uniref:GDT1 family protein n=1 Tax=Actinidia rufa TaxID=165716 RepID=A0A7J0G780_9ERIC|nr:uncharacterized protein family [Actinidia rufa]
MKLCHTVVWWGSVPKIKGNLTHPSRSVELPPNLTRGVYFGVSTLLEATSGDGLKAEKEEEQKEAELAVSEFLGNGAGILAAASTAVSTFLLVFVAEWGDKSFFSTIALAAASSPLGVIGER